MFDYDIVGVTFNSTIKRSANSNPVFYIFLKYV